MSTRTQRFDPRQNMNGESYEIFHYLDMGPRHLDAHYHDFYELFCFVEGDVDYWVDGSLYHLKAGDILLIAPTALHKPIPRTETERYERIVLWINKGYLSQLEEGLFERCFQVARPTDSRLLRPAATQKNKIFSLLQTFVREFYSEELGSRSCAYGLLLQCLTQIGRIAATGETGAADDSRTPTFIADILAYINEHYGETLSLDSLADHFFINKYYLSHEFKKAVGTSVHRYITLKRLNIAYDLLSEGTPPHRVSGLCGFKDYTGFFRAFKAEFGISPTACGKT